MASEYVVDKFEKWLNGRIEGVDEIKCNAEQKGENVVYLQGYLKALNDIKCICFDGGIYNLKEE